MTSLVDKQQARHRLATSHFLFVMAPNKQTLEVEPQETEFLFDRPVTYIEARKTATREGYQLANLAWKGNRS